MQRVGQWLHQVSDVYPFSRCYQFTDTDGSEVQVDYHPGKKLARIGISENGRECYSIVKEGMPIREKDAELDQDIDFESVVRPFKSLINTLPNSYVLGLLGGAYGLRRENEASPSVYISPFLKKRQRTPRTLKEWYYYLFLGRWPDQKPKRPREPFWPRFKRRFWSEVLDISLACGFSAAVFMHWWDMRLTGFSMGSAAMLCGLADWRIRRRNPLISKVLLLFAVGGYLYFYGYMYE